MRTDSTTTSTTTHPPWMPCPTSMVPGSPTESYRKASEAARHLGVSGDAIFWAWACAHEAKLTVDEWLQVIRACAVVERGMRA